MLEQHKVAYDTYNNLCIIKKSYPKNLLLVPELVGKVYDKWELYQDNGVYFIKIDDYTSIDLCDEKSLSIRKSSGLTKVWYSVTDSVMTEEEFASFIKFIKTHGFKKEEVYHLYKNTRSDDESPSTISSSFDNDEGELYAFINGGIKPLQLEMKIDEVSIYLVDGYYLASYKGAPFALFLIDNKGFPVDLKLESGNLLFTRDNHLNKITINVDEIRTRLYNI